jgi:hypothetical protein
VTGLKLAAYLTTALLFSNAMLAGPKTPAVRTVFFSLNVAPVLRNTFPQAVQGFERDLPPMLAKAAFFDWKPKTEDSEGPEFEVMLIDHAGGVVLSGQFRRATNGPPMPVTTVPVFTRSEYREKRYHRKDVWPNERAKNESFANKLRPAVAEYLKTAFRELTAEVPIATAMEAKQQRIVVWVPYSLVAKKVLRGEALHGAGYKAVPLRNMLLEVTDKTTEGAAITYPRVEKADLSLTDWRSFGLKPAHEAVYLNFGDNDWRELRMTLD